MYYYIYDSFLNDKKYQAVLARIENRLTDLGINGRIGRLSLLKDINELIGDELKRGVQTIVAVGNDKTVNQVVNVIAPKQDVALGIIPVGPKNKMAELLGIPPEEKACDILSARKTEKLDVARIDEKKFYFLSGAIVPSQGVSIRFDEGFSVTPIDQEGYISIYNFFCPMSSDIKSSCTDPQNGLLEISVEAQPDKGFIKKMKEKPLVPSVFPAKKISLESKKAMPIIVDCEVAGGTPATIRVLPQKLKIIVGKTRAF